MFEHILVGLLILAVAFVGFVLYQAHKNHVSAQDQLKTDVREAHHRIELLELSAGNELRALKGQVAHLFNKSGPSVTANVPIKVDGQEASPAPVTSSSAVADPKAGQS